MVDFHRLKNLGTDIIGRAGDIAEQAKDKVAPLAEQAKEKVVPLAGKAKDVAAKGVDKAAGGLDSATGHKYHDKLGAVTGNRDKRPATDSAPAAPPLETHPDDLGGGSAADTVDVVDADTGDGALATQNGVAGDDTGSDQQSTLATDAATIGDGGAAETHGSALDGSGIDGSALDGHPPTPADMPSHRPADETS